MRLARILDTRALVNCRFRAAGAFACRRAVVALAASLLFAGASLAADRVVGANATLDIEPGARSAALGSATMAVDGDYLGLVSNPHQLSSVRYLWASFSHTAYYEDTRYDYASAVVPLSEGQGLGISFARFGADDIPYIREGDPLPEGNDYNTLSIADWMFSATWGRRLFNRFDLGVGFHLHQLGFDLHRVDGFLNLFCREVGETDGSYLAFLYRLFDIPVSFTPVVCRLMKEKDIHVIRIKTLQHLIHGCFLLIYGRPEL